MVEFADWKLPLRYADHTVQDNVLFTRCHSALFDVSHMFQIDLGGRDVDQFIQRVLPVATSKLSTGSSKYSLILNESAGIIDDVILMKLSSSVKYPHHQYRIISNASRATAVWAHLMENRRPSVDVHLAAHQDRVLLALQGPDSSTILRSAIPSISPSLDRLKFMQNLWLPAEQMVISRSGYTGEDGFELYFDSHISEQLTSCADALVQSGSVQLAGLASRDILRLEAGYCLYGKDLDESTTPVEAKLLWTIDKENEGFLGRESLMTFLRPKGGLLAPRRQRHCLIADVSGPPLREGHVLYDPEGRIAGKITSGAFSPHLKRSIAMGYLDCNYCAGGEQHQQPLCYEVRGRTYTISRLPTNTFLPLIRQVQKLAKTIGVAQ